MSWTALTNGYNIVEHQIVSGVDKPMYPFTRSANIEVAADANSGTALQSAQDAFQDLFDRTKYATSAKAGIVKVTSTLAEDPISANPELVAASIGALKTLSDTVEGIGTDYMKTEDYSFGAYDANANQSLATLGSDGHIPAAQLPSFVDDIVEVQNMAADYSSCDLVPGQSSTAALGQTNVIYVDVDTNLTYRYSNNLYVEISKSLALGTTSSTAFAGDRGLALETWKNSMTTSTGNISKPANTNGVIQVNETTITVFELVKSEIETVLGAATDSTNGYMSSTDHTRFTQLSEGYEIHFYNTGSTAPTPVSGYGVNFEIISADT